MLSTPAGVALALGTKLAHIALRRVLSNCTIKFIASLGCGGWGTSYVGHFGKAFMRVPRRCVGMNTDEIDDSLGYIIEYAT